MNLSKRVLSIILSAMILISTLTVGAVSAFAAADDYTAEEPQIYSATVNVLPENAHWNDDIVFTVVTDTNTSKVKVCSSDGSIFTLANALNGYSNYSDSGSRRTWNISKSIEIIEPKNLYIYAGNCCYEYSDDYILIESEKVIVDVASVTLDKTSLSLKVGEATSLVATVLPEDASNKTVTWSSTNEGVAKVVGGVVTAVCRLR